MKLTPTASQTAGPYLHIGLTARHSVSSIPGTSTPGPRIRLQCRVIDSNGQPVPDAMIELWQADAEGHYTHPDDPHPNSAFGGFGRLATNPEGVCIFETIRPGRVPASDGRLQAPHISVLVFARGLLKKARHPHLLRAGGLKRDRPDPFPCAQGVPLNTDGTAGSS